ncbi:Macrolide export protein MacA [Geodia barretti]|uniref:Macrolide export protein MacA n=1 Tax=Geodia barretti TaxID=519541 RepID=A0AA35WJ20_GEOBA|nr:Macrolide export protein MacA [Geodia barretti]
MKKVVVALALAAGALTVVLLSVESPDTRIRVEAQTVSPRDFLATVEASGVVRPEESVDISAEVVGRLLAIRVRPGDPVAPGQIVALIDDAIQRPIVEEQRAGLREAEAILADAEVAERDARRERERAGSLHAEGVVSARAVEEAQVALDRAGIAADRARQNIERARSALRRTEENLAKTVVRSPMQGIVLEVELEEGELADIPEVDVVSVELGQPVEITLSALRGTTLSGEVIEIQRVGQRDETARLGAAGQGAEFLAKIRVHDPPPAVRPSMSAQVRIETERRADALAVPIGALLRRFPEGAGSGSLSVSLSGGEGANVSGQTTSRAPGWQVAFVIEDDRVAERRVTTGLSDLLEVEITAGLTAGDVVVVGPPLILRELSDGDEVIVEAEDGDPDPDR